MNSNVVISKKNKPLISAASLKQTSSDLDLFEQLSEPEPQPQPQPQPQVEPQTDSQEPQPVPVTDKAKLELVELMKEYTEQKEKIKDINEEKKAAQAQLRVIDRKLTEKMKMYGLEELIKDDKQFLLEPQVKKPQLKKDEFRKALIIYFKDENTVDEAYKFADSCRREVVIEKLRCLKYNPPKKKSK
jgi:hypothetical protein